MFDGSFRKPFDAAVAPVARALGKTNASADGLTVAGLVFAAGTMVALSRGSFGLSLALLALTGLADALDGAVAKNRGESSDRGAYLDSVSDRLSDALIFFGLSWYYSTTDDPSRALLPFGLYIAASLVSYQRAKAESLGYVAKGGLMERAERFIALGIGFGFSDYLIWVLWLMGVLTVLTAVLRFYRVWTQATAERENN